MTIDYILSIYNVYCVDFVDIANGKLYQARGEHVCRLFSNYYESLAGGVLAI